MDPAQEVPFNISVSQLHDWRQEGRELTLLDVREPHEFEICSIEGARLLPIREIPERWQELDASGLIVVHCHHGPRSTQVVAFLRQQGLTRVTNLDGGIDAWSLQIDPSVPRY